MSETPVIRTPDQRVRIFVSSTLSELAAERQAVRDAVTRLRLVPVMFELGARPHPPRNVYRAYLAQSQVFVGVYWQSYGWIAPGEQVSGLEDEYQLSAGLPRLIYVKSPAPDREPRLAQLLARIQDEGGLSYRRFSDPAELQQLVENDLALLLSERFEAARFMTWRWPARPGATWPARRHTCTRGWPSRPRPETKPAPPTISKSWEPSPHSKTTRSARCACSPAPVRSWKPEAADGCTPTCPAPRTTMQPCPHCAPASATPHSRRRRRGPRPSGTGKQ